MARKLYALALEKCAPESADNPMMQEVLLGGHLYLMCLKVTESSVLIQIFKKNCHAVCYSMEFGHISVQKQPSQNVDPYHL